MRPGEIVPDFELPDETGTNRSLCGFLASGPVALFFYPAAMTAGCTAEACHFRDRGEDFRSLGVQRVGISRDPVSKQREFAASNGFDFPLLSDSDGKVAEMFGVRRLLAFLPVRRWTFLIGTDKRLIEVIKSETRMSAHADRALRGFSSVGPQQGT